MSRFSRRIPFLQDLFPSSARDVIAPSEVSDIIQLVHPWPGRTLGLSQMIALQIASPAALAPVLDHPNFDGVFDAWGELIYCDISHNSATARAIAVFMKSPLGFNTEIARFTNFASAQVAGQPSGFEPLFGTSSGGGATSERLKAPWPVIVPPGWHMSIAGDAAGVAYTITGSFVIVRHTLHDPPVAI